MPKLSLKPLLCSVPTKRYKTKTKISDLVDDCLYLVFDHLSLEQKFGIKRVNKKWCRVICEMIEYGETRIVLDNSLPMSNPMHLCNLINWDLRFLHYFNKYGIIKLVLDGYWTDYKIPLPRNCILYPNHFVSILMELPQLKSLKMKCLYLASKPNNRLDNWIEGKLNMYGSQLESLSAKFCQPRDYFVDLARALLKNAKELKKLKLDYVDASLLQLIATEMRNLQVMCLCNVAIDNISYLTADKLLKRVSFYDYRLAFKDLALNHFQRIKTLESLDLDFDKVRFGSQFLLENPSQPSNLSYFSIKKLYLSCFAISNVDMDLLAKNLPLVEKLSFCRFKVNCVSLEHNVESGKYCNECVKALVRQFISFEYLSVLKLNIVYDNEDCVTMTSDVFETLAEMLEDASILKSLRKLCCFDKCKKAGKLFKAFCKKASETPDKQFQFLVSSENKKYVSSKAKPRNVVILKKLAINCKDNYFTKNGMATKSEKI